MLAANVAHILRLVHVFSILKQCRIKCLPWEEQLLVCLFVVEHEIAGAILGEANGVIFFGKGVIAIEDAESVVEHRKIEAKACNNGAVDEISVFLEHNGDQSRSVVVADVNDLGRLAT
jgi:hypothetical protein